MTSSRHDTVLRPTEYRHRIPSDRSSPGSLSTCSVPPVTTATTPLRGHEESLRSSPEPSDPPQTLLDPYCSRTQTSRGLPPALNTWTGHTSGTRVLSVRGSTWFETRTGTVTDWDLWALSVHRLGSHRGRSPPTVHLGRPLCPRPSRVI